MDEQSVSFELWRELDRNCQLAVKGSLDEGFRRCDSAKKVMDSLTAISVQLSRIVSSSTQLFQNVHDALSHGLQLMRGDQTALHGRTAPQALDNLSKRFEREIELAKHLGASLEGVAMQLKEVEKSAPTVRQPARGLTTRCYICGIV